MTNPTEVRLEYRVYIGGITEWSSWKPIPIGPDGIIRNLAEGYLELRLMATNPSQLDLRDIDYPHGMRQVFKTAGVAP